MDRLYLLRHGLALPHGTPEIADDDRPLTPEGERRVRSVGRGLRRLGIKLDQIATSPLPRALRTAEIVAEVYKGEIAIETVDLLAQGADAGTIRDWLTTRSERRLLVVGHNPSLSELLGLLVAGPDRSIAGLRKAGVAALRPVPGSDRYQIDWIARPKLFRR